MSGLWIIGAGGHAKVIIALARELDVEVEACLDDNPSTHGTQVLGVPVVGPFDAATLKGKRAVIAIGNNDARRRVAAQTEADWLALVHPRAFVDATVELGAGAIVFAGAVIQPDARIGAHAILNTSASVDHDCVIGDFAHLAPGVHLAGNVTVEEGAFLGVGVSVIPGRRIGAWATVGAGAAVVRDIPDHATAVGVPARVRG